MIIYCISKEFFFLINIKYVIITYRKQKHMEDK